MDIKELTSGIVIELTPEQANELLRTCNNTNRMLKGSLVKKYAKAMIDGDWVESLLEGNTLVIDNDGELLSAQHRLAAQVKAGITKKWIIQIVDRNTWLTLSNETRTQKDRILMSCKELEPFIGIAVTSMNQIDNITKYGEVNQSHGIGKTQEAIDASLSLYKESMLKGWEVINKPMYSLSGSDLKIMQKSLMLLYLLGEHSGVKRVVEGHDYYANLIMYARTHGTYNIPYLTAALHSSFSVDKLPKIYSRRCKTFVAPQSKASYYLEV